MNALAPLFGKDFDRFFIGFDEQFNSLQKLHDDLTKNIPNYPPYNIKKTSENTYVVELAVAGFAKQDIEIEIADGKMVIKGNVASDDSTENYLFKGIAGRNFSRQFVLSDTVVVQGAELADGILSIQLENVIPECQKPRKVEIK